MRLTSRTLAAIIAMTLTGSLLSACGGIGANDGASQQKTVESIVVASGELPKPHTFVDDNGRLDGYDIKVLEEVDRRLPAYEFTYQKVEFSGMLTGLDSDRYQIAANAFSITPERSEKYYASTPYFRDKYGIVTPEGGKPIASLKELGGKSTLATTGVAITDQLEALNKTTLKNNPIRINYTQADSATTYLDLTTTRSTFCSPRKATTIPS